MKEETGHLIAIVDDDESIREATTNLLKSYSFRAATFSSAEEFLNSSLVEKTKCLLLDLAMPGMSGLELQRRLAADRRRIPIIFITAHDSPEVRAQALREGAVAFLPKPFSEQALLTAIHMALEWSPRNLNH
jgi:FixJ family two-component response regulator